MRIHLNHFARTVLLLWVVIFIIGCASTTVPFEEEIVWPAPPETPRIKYLRSISGKQDMKRSRYERFIESLAGRNVQQSLIKPYGVAVDSAGRIFVTDIGSRSVLMFDESAEKGGDSFKELGRSGEGVLQSPIGITIDPDNNIYVSDIVLNLIYCYDNDLKYIRTIGDSEMFERPTELTYNIATDELIVTDTKAHNLKFFDKAGNLIRTVGKNGIGDGEFNYPSNVTSDADGNIYVVDAMNFRVQIFNQAGEFLSAFGEASNKTGNFGRPKGIALDSEGHIYVADAAFENIQIFQNDGKLLLYFGSAGVQPGYFQIPIGLYMDQHDKLYVVDQLNRRIQIFQYLKY